MLILVSNITVSFRSMDRTQEVDISLGDLVEFGVPFDNNGEKMQLTKYAIVETPHIL